MDKDMPQGHQPEHVDLTQIEDQPGARVDPLFERQTDDTEIRGPWFGARFSSNTPVRSPAGTATALLKVVLAASLPAAGFTAGGWAMGVTGWLTLTLADVVFLVVGTVGVLLILRTKPAPRQTTSNGNKGDNADTNLRTPCQADQRPSHHASAHPTPTPGPRALQPPRRR